MESVSGAVSAPVQTISRYRRGYKGEPTPLNAEFEIDPAANAGIPFAFDDVVRGRRHRHGLIAGECEECHGVGAYIILFDALTLNLAFALVIQMVTS